MNMKFIKNLTLLLLLVVLVAIGYFIYVILTPEQYVGYPNIRETVLAIATAATVFATLLLAYANFNLIDSSNKQETQRNKELKLKEVINWAVSATNGDFEAELNRMAESIFSLKKQKKIELEESNKLLAQVFGRNRYMIVIAESIDQELKISVEKLDKKLRDLSIEMLDKAWFAGTHQAFADFYLDIFKAANVVIEKSAKLL
jgi:hypothetical protein